MIQDAAVEAALSTLRAASITGPCGVTYREMRAALEAAAPYMLAEAKAEAWDEALIAGEHWCRELNPSEIANPHRSSE